MAEVNACWCSAGDREPFGPHYARCGGCGTLVYTGSFDVADYQVGSGETAFYGAAYWERHVPEVLQLPRLEERAHTDLTSRSIHYLEGVLEFLDPGSKVLELGCAPGSLAYLMDLAGFRTTGVELGAEVVAFAREQFDINVVEGPIENVDIDGPFDGVVLLDVLEHLPLPLATLKRCAELLTDEGVLIVQTPCHRGESPDWPMLIPKEHLFLYTEKSVRRLLDAAGFQVVDVRSALHPHDMWVVASRGKVCEPRPAPLDGVAPIAVAMIELFGAVGRERNQGDRLLLELEAAQADHREQVASMKVADEELAALREDQAAKQTRVEEISADLAAVQSDQASKEALIAELTDEISAVRRDQAAKQSRVEEISADLAAARSDQASKEALIAELTDEISAVRRDQAAKQSRVEEISADLDAAQSDQASKEALIAELTDEISAVRSDQAAKQSRVEEISADLAAAQSDQAGKEALIAELTDELAAARADQGAKLKLIEQMSDELAEVRADQAAKEALIAELVSK